MATPKPFAIYPQDASKAAALSESMSISPTLAQILINRGVASAEEAELFLFGGGDCLHDPEMLDGLGLAADIVVEAMRDGTRMVIHGDYDADGVSGTALLVAFLRDLGALVEPYIPHRIDEGYGLSREGILWAGEERFGLLVSVDCGSSSPQEVALARSLGMKVVVTDHHMVGEAPPADAFVNPRAPGSTYPYPHLSGAGVAFKLTQAIAKRLGRGTPTDYLDLAAIGTVGDVVPLTGENRILVREGLEVMGRMERPGIVALARASGLLEGDQPTLSSVDIAFQLAPRINACGRLEHARTAAELLLETNHVRAEELANQINLLNQRRRETEAVQREDAERQIAERGLSGAHAIVEASTEWHQGLVGIIANRLLDRHGLPAFIISIGADGIAKGSARAPAHVDLFACLTACKDLFLHYGGHPRAGGFSMRTELVDSLRERLQQVVPTMAVAAEAHWKVDAELPLAAVDLGLAEELEMLAPLGQANPSPLFLARGVRLRFPELVKERHLRFVAAQPGASARCIAFFMGDRIDSLNAEETYDILYQIEKQIWREEARVSYIVKEIYGKPVRTEQPPPAWIAQSTPPPARTEAAARMSLTMPANWIDARGEANRGRYLADLVRSGAPVAVMVRRGLVDFTKRVVSGDPQAPVPSNLHVVVYGDPWPSEPLQECVLFSPPPSVEALKPVMRLSDVSVHILFGAAEIKEEEVLVKSVAMSRERVAAVYRLLQQCGSSFTSAAFQQVAKKLGSFHDRVETVKVVARILREIGVLDEAQPNRFVFTGRRAMLEDSPIFMRYAAIEDTFERVKEMFSAPSAGQTVATP